MTCKSIKCVAIDLLGPVLDLSMEYGEMGFRDRKLGARDPHGGGGTVKNREAKKLLHFEFWGFTC